MVMREYLVNVQETFIVEATREEDVFEVPRSRWQLVESDVMVVGEE